MVKPKKKTLEDKYYEESERATEIKTSTQIRVSSKVMDFLRERYIPFERAGQTLERVLKELGVLK